MPWSTPTLRDVRSLVRDHIRGSLPGADATVPNSVLRVMSDAMGALCHLVLQYIDWLSLQLLPDTAETEWLDRHGTIWLVNSDGTLGRKGPTLARGEVTFTGAAGAVVPMGTRISHTGDMQYETTLEITLSADASPAPIIAIDPGSAGNLVVGSVLGLQDTIAGVDNSVVVVDLRGGTDEETDDQLRMRVLIRIRNPPMGGDAMDYVIWTLAVPGVTRAWSAPLEQGMGTVTVRFMCDDLRAEQDGFPQDGDIEAVTAYLDTVRPVAIKDYFVVAPIPEPINFTIENLQPEDAAVRGSITESVKAMLHAKAAPAYSKDGVMQPAQTIYAAWVSAAISDAPEVDSFRLIMEDHPMPHAGALAVLGTITYI